MTETNSRQAMFGGLGYTLQKNWILTTKFVLLFILPCLTENSKYQTLNINTCLLFHRLTILFTFFDTPFSKWCFNSTCNFQAPYFYRVWGFSISHVCLSVSDPILIGCDKSCDIRIIETLICLKSSHWLNLDDIIARSQGQLLYQV